MKPFYKKIAIKVALLLFGPEMASCAKANSLCSEARDRRLALGERVFLFVHNRLCLDCERYADQLDTVCRCAKHRPDRDPMPECAKKRVADRIREADAADARK